MTCVKSVKAELRTRFQADMRLVPGVGQREGISILLTIDPTIGVPANSMSGANTLYGFDYGFQLGRVNPVININPIFPNSNLYERVDITNARLLLTTIKLNLINCLKNNAIIHLTATLGVDF